MKPKTFAWVKIADNDLAVARDNFRDGHFAHAAYLCHQTVEKYLKAVVQELTNEIPPHTHNFNVLLETAGIKIYEEIEEKILRLAPHYIPTRYPEELEKLQEQYTHEATEKYINDTEEIILWLKNNYLK